jgi:uncharacterized protein YjbI with pentapeptide repeats
VEQEPKTPRERADDLIRLLVPGWRPTPQQVVWGIRIVLAFVIVLGVLTLVGRPFDITLWQWLDLLIIPAVLAVGGYLFTRSENRAARFVAQQRAQDEALQAYLDQMSQMLSDRDRPLRRARPGDDLSTVARAQTLTVLLKLDGARKGSLLRFLYESGLLNKDSPVFELHGADLSGADLSRTALGDATLPPSLFSPDPTPHRGTTFAMLDLSGANLSGANLNHANLSRTILRAANLTRAHLNDATLDQTWLDEADLSYANLNYAKLRAASLRGVSLFGAHLDLANLRGAQLPETNLDTVSLIGADLSGAVLSGANLTHANLYRTNLSGANLSGANLSGVILQGPDPIDDAAIQAQFERTNLTGAIMPDGQVLKGPERPNGPTFTEWLKSSSL